MAKWCNSSFQDAAFDWLQGLGTHEVVVSASCSTSAAISSAALASAATASADYSKAAGDTSGRKVTIASHSGCTIDASGTANYVVICLADGTPIYQTSCTAQALTSGTVDVPAWDIEILAPA